MSNPLFGCRPSIFRFRNNAMFSLGNRPLCFHVPDTQLPLLLGCHVHAISLRIFYYDFYSGASHAKQRHQIQKALRIGRSFERSQVFAAFPEIYSVFSRTVPFPDCRLLTS